VFDFHNNDTYSPTDLDALLKKHAGLKPALSFLIWKRTFDLIGALLLVPLVVFFALVLLVANPFFNPGPLFFTQKRMGRECEPFQALKFRTMVCASEITRSAFDPLEHDRITPFGRFLRRCRIDELPQVLNVLRCDMSLIGPRPDFYDHAVVYVDVVHGYRERHRMRPGISGYAQVRHGYIEGIDGVRNKVSADLQYIANASVRIDLQIAWATIKVIVGSRGM
jgi:lipopolysaccharide/colanic/teichoic acid biosynthesis glycosyltransferase